MVASLGDACLEVRYEHTWKEMGMDWHGMEVQTVTANDTEYDGSGDEIKRRCWMDYVLNSNIQ